MNFAEFYNHERAKQEAKEGAKIIADTQINSNPPKFNAGDRVISTNKSHMKIFPEDNAWISSMIKTCYGYYWYSVKIQRPNGKVTEFPTAFKDEELQKI